MKYDDRAKQLTKADYLNVSPFILLPFATIFSFFLTGYVPALSNNIYHLPILMRDYDLAQFKDDEFVQSLRHFSSGFWIVFAGAGKQLNPKIFLGIWLFLTHLSFLAACLHFARSLGCESNRQRNIFLLLSCCSSLTMGLAVGDGGLMLNHFTHSELANASLVLALSFAVRKRYLPAALSACATFFLNAFMAVWLVPVLAALIAYQLAARKMTIGRLLKDGAIGSAIGMIFLVPPILNIVGNPEVSETLGFSYKSFLWDLYPYHFFISSLTVTNAIKLASVVLVMVLAGLDLEDNRSEFMAVAAGALLLLFLAAIVGALSESRLVLNLHLLRGAVIISILAFVGIAVKVSRSITASTSIPPRRLALAMCGILLLPIAFSPLLVAALLLDRAVRSGVVNAGVLRNESFNLVVRILLIACVAFLPVRSYSALSASASDIRLSGQWERIGRWAKEQTDPEAVFYVPENGALPFSYASKRRVWIAGKYGAAVMWSPSYHRIWEQRKFAAEPASLPGIVDRLRGKIDYLADGCEAALPDPVAFEDDGICVYTLVSR
jgi:hypothetical protein